MKFDKEDIACIIITSLSMYGVFSLIRDIYNIIVLLNQY